MPWIEKDDCIGCGLCVDECPTDSISMEDEKAEIDMDHCIRCGKCHDICPQDAVRHDSEKAGERIERNIEWTKDLMKYYETREDKKRFLQRMKNHFNNEKRIAEKTIETLESLGF